MSNKAKIVAVTCLTAEARIASGPGVSVICSQGRDLVVSVEEAIAGGAAGVISFGVAGGLAPELAAGDWLIGLAILTDQHRFPTDALWARRLLASLPGARQGNLIGVDAPVAKALEKRRLHDVTGAIAVDMESHIAAQIAAAHRLPFAACRVVIDAAHRNLPPAALVGLRPDGSPDIRGVCRSVARLPHQLPALVRTAMDAHIAQRALTYGRRLLGPSFGFPDTENPPLCDGTQDELSRSWQSIFGT